MKNPLTPTGIEPATYRFVAQHLNHCATAVRPLRQVHRLYSIQYLVTAVKESTCGLCRVSVVSRVWRKWGLLAGVVLGSLGPSLQHISLSIQTDSLGVARSCVRAQEETLPLPDVACPTCYRDICPNWGEPFRPLSRCSCSLKHTNWNHHSELRSAMNLAFLLTGVRNVAQCLDIRNC